MRSCTAGPVYCHTLRDICVTFILFLCAVNVYLPKDRVTSQHQGYGFVEFKSEEDADYVSTLAAFLPSSAL